MAHDETVFEPDAAWTRALEKYGAATHLAVELYGRDEHLILGPVHRTPLFELLAPGHHALSMFAACVQRCLTQTAAASTIVVEQRHSLAVIGSPLMLNGEVVGAAVAAYVLTAFPDEHAVRRLAIECGVPFTTLWQQIRAELPLTRARLNVYGELLQVLCNALLSENVRVWLPPTRPRTTFWPCCPTSCATRSGQFRLRPRSSAWGGRARRLFRTRPKSSIGRSSMWPGSWTTCWMCLGSRAAGSG